MDCVITGTVAVLTLGFYTTDSTVHDLNVFMARGKHRIRCNRLLSSLLNICMYNIEGHLGKSTVQRLHLSSNSICTLGGSFRKCKIPVDPKELAN